MVPNPERRPTSKHPCYTPGVAPAVPLSTIIFDKAADIRELLEDSRI